MLDVLREKSFSSDLINFFEMLVHDSECSIVGVEIVGRISDNNRYFFTHFCDTKVSVPILKLRITYKLDFILRINRSFIIQYPLLTELIFTLYGDVMNFGLNLE
jgi:hypothetical protein